MQHTRYPYLDYVELFTATGGCYLGFAGCEDTRDLLNDPSAPGLSSGVNASRLIVPLRHILDAGFTPHIVYVERDATIRPEFHAHLPHQVCCANTPLFPAHWSAPPWFAYMRFMLVDAMHVALHARTGNVPIALSDAPQLGMFKYNAAPHRNRSEYREYVGRNKQPPLATKNLLEVPDGLRRSP